ncbi:hypothetical protein PACTADRAFT_14498 [Pachysolen tannophilus NRRL Y-2460]|uniref:Ubiquitin fusion degradation protein 1 n=1 Tax=Pachysolen tannophilus NRRL Y-2460 TaxID=669874 RepID=A0A1E4U1Y1_PACTA|nr:hypothetical protein PACTADRAFT_14498 [Pachysolen tannophilus NRRL Y-2460]
MFSGFASQFAQFNIPSNYEAWFRCYPIAMMSDLIRKEDANFGGKIFLPPSSLNQLTQLNIRYPMLFELENEALGIKTHSGVLEFVAEEGRAYLPQWMMETLQVQPGSLIKVANADLPSGSFVRIQPQSEEFLDISDPKAVLENCLRKFSTLTVDDIIQISYNEKLYHIKVLEVKPESVTHSICVVETDLETDFAPPPGYEEKMEKLQKENKERAAALQKNPNSNADIANRHVVTELGSIGSQINYDQLLEKGKKGNEKWEGKGFKLSGKGKSTEKIESKNNNANFDNVKTLKLDGPPVPLNLEPNVLFFGFPYIPPALEENEKDKQDSKTNAFQGEGQSLRVNRKRKK